MQRLRVEKMERQLANLTGLVQKALQVPNQPPVPTVAPRQEYPQTYQSRPATQGKLRSRNLPSTLVPSRYLDKPYV